MRIEEHPVLEGLGDRPEVEIYVNGRRCGAREGDTVASALWALGIRRFRRTRRLHEPRGPFCFIGRCTDCEVTVDGRPRVKSCMTSVRGGMRIELPEDEW
jgi:predicted molibdopterin-dependent oxidoreductase YjgC